MLALTAWGSALLLAAGACGLFWSAREPLGRQLSVRLRRLDRQLRYLRLPVSATRLSLMLLASSAALLAAALTAKLPALLPLSGFVLFGPFLWLGRKARARTQQIEQQIDSWLSSLAGTLKATPSLGDALASTRKLVPAPLGDELETVLRETALGTPLDAALRNMGARIDSATLSAALVVLRVARNTGGGLHRTLELTAGNLREMARLEGVVRTKTAEGRAQSLVVSVVPIALTLGLHIISPGFLDPLFKAGRGHAVLTLAALLWVVSFLWARKIVAVEL